MNGELLALLEYYERERGIEKNSLFEAVESALLLASKKSVGPSRSLRIEIDRKTGALRAIAQLVVVENVTSQHDEITYAKARLLKADVQLGEAIDVEVTPRNFGRIAAQTAKQAILQRIRQVEKEKILVEFKDRVGDIVSGIVRRFERSDVIVDVGHCEALLPQRERVPTEEYQPGDRLRCYILSVETSLQGPEIILSRAHPDFIKRLFQLEVSEIGDGTVEIRAIAREPGYRTKIAVVSRDEKVDPVGACVGMRGTRVKNIVRELSNERMDIIPWRANPREFIIEALKPAKLKSVEVDEAAKIARVSADEDQLSLAIGKRGQNVRLAMKITGYKIDVVREETTEVAFEQKVARAIAQMAAIPGIDEELAGKLVHAGFLSVEGLLAADVSDLEACEGLDRERAQAILDAARAERARREKTLPTNLPTISEQELKVETAASAPTCPAVTSESAAADATPSSSDPKPEAVPPTTPSIDAARPVESPAATNEEAR